MKKLLLVLFVVSFAFIQAQQTANRFFYEFTFKPKKQIEVTDKVMTILDILDKKSVYEDFTTRAQDSIVKNVVETAAKTGQRYDLAGYVKVPKFDHKITKSYPDMEKVYVQDWAGPSLFGYNDVVKFDWKILNEKEKIGEYNAQKATTEFGGRKWTAWFSTDFPFQDGPYKFYGLPGLIVKIEDTEKNFSWVLQGNKKIEDYDEVSYTQRMVERQDMVFTPIQTTKEKFEKALESYRSDPLRRLRQKLTPEMMSEMVPGENRTVGEMFREEEKKEKAKIDAYNNPIEILLKK
ncbi:MULTISPECIES: GLPGLI family protein [Chryseobacterium]|uniref:GLPGLI family protein n=1 Tax=Chryseobacterium geocarposphaerae TaxID=1416776 RepID=A0ABU1LED5_9FLAO|nr:MULTISPECIES: GLPGLI family protein [Chryseobacterium]MDR6405069.1 GLPGLI family protein [Chryseobacterium geocarposphaerae]MDR6697852.1 GLPGLI family protein [Chryseobacterium ginsenosidimutans]